MVSQQATEELFEGVESFLNYYESSLCERFTTKENIKRIFALANFLEAACKKIKVNSSEIAFNETLSNWCSINKRTLYNITFFEKSCDHVLRKFLQADVSHTLKEEAFQNYSASVDSAERTAICIEYFTNEATLLHAMFKINNIISSYAQPEDKNAWHILGQLSLLYQQHKLEQFKDTVTETFCKDIICIESILKALTVRIGNNCQENREIKQLIMTTILNSLDNDNSLRSQFWKLSCWTDQKILGEILILYPDFLQANLTFLMVSVQSLKADKDKLSWKNPEELLTYDEIVVMIKCLISAQGSAEHAVTSLVMKNASERRDCCIWRELREIIRNR